MSNNTGRTQYLIMQRARRGLGPGPEPRAKRRSPGHPRSRSPFGFRRCVRLPFVFGVYGAAFLRRTSWKNSKNDRKPPDKINHKTGGNSKKTKTVRANSSRFNYAEKRETRRAGGREVKTETATGTDGTDRLPEFISAY